MATLLKVSAGSSPHARGALENLGDLVGRDGIIPACAGSTASTRSTPGTPRDHPRMRGEHVDGLGRGLRLRGSSPHARGAHNAVALRVAVAGIIPACAGSTLLYLDLHARNRDHPRMRGEHLQYPGTPLVLSGSSPHARGALDVFTADGFAPGIIPACAGSTRSQPGTRRSSRDHPRMRGEHSGAVRVEVDNTGSSPHARGAPRIHSRPERHVGIIPACAGSTLDR